MSGSEFRRVAITGMGGLVGRAVARHLLEVGAEVVGVSSQPVPELGGVPVAVGDLRDRDLARSALNSVDAIIHLAAVSGGIGMQQAAHWPVFHTNRAITDNVLDAAVRNEVGRVFLSSSAVVYRPSSAPLREDAPTLTLEDRPSGYAWSKLADEAAGRWCAAVEPVEIVIGRYTNIYGPVSPGVPPRTTVIYDLMRRALDAEPGGVLEVWGDGSAVRSFIHVDDAARAIATIAKSGTSGEIYNVDNGQEVSIKALASTIRDMIDPTLRLEFDSARPAGDPYRVLDPSKLTQLGFRAEVDLERGLEATLASVT